MNALHSHLKIIQRYLSLHIMTEKIVPKHGVFQLNCAHLFVRQGSKPTHSPLFIFSLRIALFIPYFSSTFWTCSISVPHLCYVCLRRICLFCFCLCFCNRVFWFSCCCWCLFALQEQRVISRGPPLVNNEIRTLQLSICDSKSFRTLFPC